ncbi:MAG: DUF4012 domain-containing protein, partial [Actinobacteria bacterium]|nr:DUF4012 domain-containing protein [Actinomycetota bacterium]
MVIFIIVIFALVIPLFFAYQGLKGALSHGKSLADAYKLQQFDNLKSEILSTRNGLQTANFSLNFLFWLRIIPVAGGYYLDAKKLVDAGTEELTALSTIISNLDGDKEQLRFDGHPKSGPERITQMLNLLDKSLPLLDKVEGNLIKASELVKDIDTNKYPDKVGGKKLKTNLKIAKNFIMGAAVAVKDGKEALKLAPQALGVGSSKNYLLLFQNDKEIRATGGFMTAFATLTLNNGQVQSTTSDDIYRLDEKLLNVCLTKICPFPL